MNKQIENTDEKYTTTKELANVCGVDERTVRNAVQRLTESTFLKSNEIKTISNGGRPSMIFTAQQATLIKQEIAKHHNLASRQIDNVRVKGEAMNEVLKTCTTFNRDEKLKVGLINIQSVLAELEKENNEQKIQLDKNKEYRTVKWMENYFDRKFNWRKLKKMSQKMGIEFHKVFDENYENGVNSYHKDVWKEIYGDSIANVIKEE